MNILCVAIPAKPLVNRILARHGEDLTLFLTELRPLEQYVANAIRALEDEHRSVVMLTDNMLGAVFQHHNIDAIYSTYTTTTDGNYACAPGAQIAAVMGAEFNTPFYLIKSDIPDGRKNSHFFGVRIMVDGAQYVDFQYDHVPAALVTEVLT